VGYSEDLLADATQVAPSVAARPAADTDVLSCLCVH